MISLFVLLKCICLAHDMNEIVRISSVFSYLEHWTLNIIMSLQCAECNKIQFNNAFAHSKWTETHKNSANKFFCAESEQKKGRQRMLFWRKRVDFILKYYIRKFLIIFWLVQNINDE